MHYCRDRYSDAGIREAVVLFGGKVESVFVNILFPIYRNKVGLKKIPFRGMRPIILRWGCFENLEGWTSFHLNFKMERSLTASFLPAIRTKLMFDK